MAYLADRFRDALAGGGRALFVGLGLEQLPPEFRADPWFVCWDSDEPQSTTQKFIELPARTRVVVMTRFIRHSTYHKVVHAAKRSGALVFGKLTGTGEIARLLREAFPPPDAEVAPPEATMITDTAISAIHAPIPTPPPLALGPGRPPLPPLPPPPPPPPPPGSLTTITACIRFYAQTELRRPLPAGRQRRTAVPAAFFEDLAKKVRAHGFDTDGRRIRAIFSMVRQHMLARDQPAPEAAPLVPSVPVAAPPLVAAPASDLPPDLDALVQIAETLDVRGSQAIDLADHLRRLVIEQRELRGCKIKYDQLLAILGNTPSAAGPNQGHSI